MARAKIGTRPERVPGARGRASSRTASRLVEPCDVDLTEESRHRDRRPTAELEAAGAGATYDIPVPTTV